MTTPTHTPNQAEWEGILTLLGAMLFADRNMMDLEFEAFSVEVTRLCDLIEVRAPDRKVTSAWLAAKAMDIHNEMTGDQPTLWLGKKLSALKQSPLAGEVFRALEAMALADKHIDPKEYEVLMLASAILGQLPSPKLLNRRDGQIAQAKTPS